MRKLRPVIGIILALAICAICFSPQVQTLLTLPERQQLVVGESTRIVFHLPPTWDNRLVMQVISPARSVFATPEDPPVSISRNDEGYEIVALKPGRVNVQLRLLGYIPLKSIAVESLPPRRVVVGGHSIGVLLQSRGIMVVGFAPIMAGNGEKLYPAKDGGVEIGDLIMKVDGQKIGSENDLARIIDASPDQKLILNVKRQDKYLSIPVRTAPCQETGRKRVGLFVRDGIVGVGTLTFWDPETRAYAALGHIIVDADTRQGVDVLQGKIVSASVQTIKPGRPGQPGEKIGVFNNNGLVEGRIFRNSYCGIFGTTSTEVKNPLQAFPLEVAYAHQVKEGRAQIYTVLNGDDIEKYDIVIEKVYPQRRNSKGMVIRVTDSRLLSMTGGIIQGMSGSPIVQDNKIVGAVTHVFLNDPQRGYGIFMDNMLSETDGAVPEPKKLSTKQRGA